jgi:hypothetical protein
LRVEFRQTEDTTATVWITRTAPKSTALWAWLGGLGGGAMALAALLGLARLWYGARFRTAVATLCGVGALALLPSTALVIVATALGDAAAEPLWGAYGLIGLGLLALLGVLLVAAGVLLLFLARHRPESAALALVTAQPSATLSSQDQLLASGDTGLASKDTTLLLGWTGWRSTGSSFPQAVGECPPADLVLGGGR